jgi:hypothetical protein
MLHRTAPVGEPTRGSLGTPSACTVLSQQVAVWYNGGTVMCVCCVCCACREIVKRLDMWGVDMLFVVSSTCTCNLVMLSIAIYKHL